MPHILAQRGANEKKSRDAFQQELIAASERELIAGERERDDNSDLFRIPAIKHEGDSNMRKTISKRMVTLILTVSAGMLLGLIAIAPRANAAKKTVKLAAGSVDGLAAAIASAGPGGTVIVKSGLHTESGTVLVTQPVSIIGEPDAIIESGTSPGANYPIEIDAIVHVKGTHDVDVRGLDFRPPAGGTANCAVLIEHSPHVQVIDNAITDFQFGVIVDWGDHADISRNTMRITPRGLLDPGDPEFLIETDGVVVMNGREARVEDNDLSSALFGFMGCIENGQIRGNAVSDCFGGILFCKVPDDSYIISGNTEGGHPGGTRWHAENNVVTNNYFGLGVTDGANDNVLDNNTASGNVYDIELFGTDFFGYSTSASFNNIVNAGSHKAITVHDCGFDNKIHGHVILVNDPCS